MLNITWFETREELMELTGLDLNELWDAGFNLDDWDFGIRVDQKLHNDPTDEQIAAGDAYEDELIAIWGKPGYWIMNKMNEYCCGPSYVQMGEWHYYLVHHA